MKNTLRLRKLEWQQVGKNCMVGYLEGTLKITKNSWCLIRLNKKEKELLLTTSSSQSKSYKTVKAAQKAAEDYYKKFVQSMINKYYI